MKIKTGVIALALTGGTAALAFGGSAVSTAFTSSDTATAAVSTASIGTSVHGFSISLENALPGDVQQGILTVSNNGSTPATETVAVTPGNSDNTALDQWINVYGATNTGAGKYLIGTLKNLEAAGASPVALNRPDGSQSNIYNAGESDQYQITLELDPNAPSTVAGLTTNAIFTVTGTAQHQGH